LGFVSSFPASTARAFKAAGKAGGMDGARGRLAAALVLDGSVGSGALAGADGLARFAVGALETTGFSTGFADLAGFAVAVFCGVGFAVVTAAFSTGAGFGAASDFGAGTVDAATLACVTGFDRSGIDFATGAGAGVATGFATGAGAGAAFETGAGVATGLTTAAFALVLALTGFAAAVLATLTGLASGLGVAAITLDGFWRTVFALRCGLRSLGAVGTACFGAVAGASCVCGNQTSGAFFMDCIKMREAFRLLAHV
jgi:hypothetical protein